MNVRNGIGQLCRVGLTLVVAGCAAAAPAATPSLAPSPTGSATVRPTDTPTATATAAPKPAPATFATEAFADVSEEPVSGEVAASFQAILDEAIANKAAAAGGVTATVMTANGTWSGAAGTADGERALHPDDQMAIGSVTKAVIAAQVMQMVEAGELGLDDPAADYLPADLEFDTNQATIRQLLGMRSGIPDFVDAIWQSLSTDRQHSWTTAEVLALVPATRSAAGVRTAYSSTNYVLLGLLIEQVRGSSLTSVLRNGVLSGDGLERLVYQPDEAPTEPMAMPGGESTAALQQGGGYLPSLAGATAGGPAGAMASDSATLARWWSRLCGGEIVSEASLTEMTTFQDGYGFGLDGRVDTNVTPAVGHGGIHVGFAAWAVCLVQDGSVVVVLTNRKAGGSNDGDVDIMVEVAHALAIAAHGGLITPL